MECLISLPKYQRRSNRPSIVSGQSSPPSGTRSARTYITKRPRTPHHCQSVPYSATCEPWGKDSVSELAATGHISRPAISRMVDVLVNKNLVSRTQNPQDRRQIQLALTDEGETLLNTIFDNTHHWMSEKLALLEVDELETIVWGMRSLNWKAFEEITL